jgi:hypothetical protein
VDLVCVSRFVGKVIKVASVTHYLVGALKLKVVGLALPAPGPGMAIDMAQGRHAQGAGH